DERGEDFISLVTEVNDPGYPSRLRVKVVYRLSSQSFDANFSISNIGQTDAPIVAGAHPYFNVTHPWRLYHHSKIRMLNYPDGTFPDGKLIDYSFNDIEDPGKLNLDNSFVGGGTLKLESDFSTIIIERRNMDYFEVYNGTYAGKNSVAIEPMTGAINAFNNGIGLKILPPDETMDYGFTITIL
ncbi:MAG: aldose 1-epimerase, partial [Nitrososphaerota archaeon]